ncbi:MAG TPA: alpha/beta fold hydrolase [Thermomicrobiales bacterium]|nr:alpha/beta fold hydrolase [Thermomicrobiales bacterium]
MRAAEPVEAGSLVLHEFGAGYEVFGEPDAPAVLLLPTWQIVHSRIWKMQAPHLARRFRVVTFDSPGNGRGERTIDPRAFEYDRIGDQAIGLLDHLSIASAAVVGFSRGCDFGIALAARYPERVSRLVLIANGVLPDSWQPHPDPRFWEWREQYSGWEMRNAHFWRDHYDDWLSFFFAQLLAEPHSTKGIEDSISWGAETTPEILIATIPNPDLHPRMPTREAIQRVRCPVLLMHGDADLCEPIVASQALAAARPDWTFVTLEGCGHIPQIRHPVSVNRELDAFLGAPRSAPRSWQRAMARPRRTLFVSSPIGLGHVQRDLAIARELRRIVPDLEIDWLAQPPVTQALERAGETIHPRSRELAGEAAHWESGAGEHQLHCFHAFRDMDEILLANFMVFLDAVRETPYDLWIGDEAWEVDHFLHENPELKTASYVFMTDFLGWLPIDRSPGSREAFLTADYNAEMLEHIDRYPRIRDRALYFGAYDDLAPERFGPGLPSIPAWAREHFEAVGYVVPFDPDDYVDIVAVRERLGYAPDRPLVVAAAGGTAVGRPLLEKVVAAWPLIRAERPEAECVVVAGPRIDAATIPAQPGLRVLPYVHDLYEHLAAADLGIVQGGLGTTMELAATRRPFLYFPLADHCEQLFHVAHRLERHRAGRRMEYAATTPESLAEAALATLESDTSRYRALDPQAAERAARAMAALL